MYTNSILALSGLLSLVAAAPVNKRDVVWITHTQEDVVTVPVTTTIWVDPTNGANNNWHPRPTSTFTVQSTYTAPAAQSSPVESSPAAAPSSYAAPSSSSVYVAPTTASTTSAYIAPTTSSTSTWEAPSTTQAPAPATTSSAPATYSSSSSGSGSAPNSSGWSCPGNFGTGSVSSGSGAAGSQYSGDMTWFQDGSGACGCTNGASDHIVAVSHTIFDAYTPAGNPNNNPLCGKTVTINGSGGSYTATIVDRCVGCAEGDLDLSQDFFNTVTNNGNGRVPGVSWKFD